MSIEEMILRLFLSAVLGGVVGLEREYRNKSVGLRTLILISLGSCLFTIISVLIDENSQDRIASTVVTGIGFLGAGAIFKGDFGVRGLTTAATVWVVAAIGMAIGGGYFVAGIVTVAIALIVLFILGKIQRVRDRDRKQFTYRVRFKKTAPVAERLERLMSTFNMKYKRGRHSKQEDRVQIFWHVTSNKDTHKKLIDSILADDEIESFDFSEFATQINL